MMYLSTVFLPFFGFFIASLFGRFIGKQGCAIITVSIMAFVICFSFIGFYNVGLNNDIYFIDFGAWITSGVVKIS